LLILSTIYQKANIKIAEDIPQNNLLKLHFLLQALYLYPMILVTGGTGLVGSHLLLKLSEGDDSIKATYRSRDRITEVEKLFAFAKAQSRFSKITWIQADITDIPLLTIAFKDITQVYHCAALISFDPYDFNKLIKTNVEGTANVVNLCLANGITKLCHLSTIAALSKLPNTPVNEENHWDPNEDNSVYAISKYGAETEVWRASQEDLDVLIFSPGIILGEGHLNEGSGKLFNRVLREDRYYPAGGSAFIDVKDLVNIMIYGMSSAIKNERFIAISHNYSFKQILTEIARCLSKKAPAQLISKKQLGLLVGLDRIRGVFTGKRKLTATIANSASNAQTFSNQKLVDSLHFSPASIESTIQRIARYHNTN